MARRGAGPWQDTPLVCYAASSVKMLNIPKGQRVKLLNITDIQPGSGVMARFLLSLCPSQTAETGSRPAKQRQGVVG